MTNMSTRVLLLLILCVVFAHTAPVYAADVPDTRLEQGLMVTAPTHVRVGDEKNIVTVRTDPADRDVTFTASPAEVCTVGAVDGALAFLAVGTCTVTVTQAGDETYLPKEVRSEIEVDVQLTGRIEGCIFDDLNENGVKDTGEPGIPGLQVQMHTPNGSIVGTDHRTDSEGCYVFSGLDGGTYTDFVIEPQQQVGPNPEDVVDPPFIFDQAGAFNSGVVTLLGNGSVVAGANFGGKKRGRVRGLVYNDVSGDGQQNAGDDVLVGWTVTATPVLYEEGSGEPVVDLRRTTKTTVTTSAGYELTFTEVDAGLWKIEILPPPGWVGSLEGPAYTLVRVGVGTDMDGQHVRLAVPAGAPEDEEGDEENEGGEGEEMPDEVPKKKTVLFTAGPAPVPVVQTTGGGNGPIVQSGFGPTTAGIASGGSSTTPNQTFAFVVPQGTVAGAATFKFNYDMGYGSRRDPDVRELQQILIDVGHLKIKNPTGWFGPLTRAAVRAYQTAHSIPATGFVGVETRAALNK